MLEQKFDAHQQLELHPVGKALLARVQYQLDSDVAAMKHDQEIQNNTWDARFKLHDDMDKEEFKGLDEKLQREFTLANKAIEQRQTDLEKEIALIQNENCSSFTRLENAEVQRVNDELQELRAWRNKAAGLASPDKTTVLMPKEINIPAK